MGGDSHFSQASLVSSTPTGMMPQPPHLNSQASSQSQQMSAALSVATAAHMMNVSGPSPTYQPAQASIAQAPLPLPSMGLMSMSQHSHMPSQMQGLMANMLSPDMSTPMQQLSLNGQDFAASYATGGVPQDLTFSDLNAMNSGGDFGMHSVMSSNDRERLHMFDIGKE